MAIEFDGDSFVEFGSWSNPGATGQISVSLWIVPTDVTSSLQRIWGAATHMELRIGGGGAGTEDKLFNDMYEQSTPLASTVSLVNDRLYHIVCLGDGTADFNRMYVDGVFDHEELAATGSSVGGSTMQIGLRTGVGISNAFHGFIEDWRSYNRILSEAEIQTIFAARGHDGIVDGLTTRLIFNEQANGTTLLSTHPKDLIQTVSVNSVTGTPFYRESRGLSFRKRMIRRKLAQI